MQDKRYHDLDFVRAIAMLLGILIHVNIFFMPPSELFWGTGEYQGDVVNMQSTSFIHLFRMQLFFLIAGFFAELVADRKGFRHLVGDRVKRILLPFIVGILILMPIHRLLLNGDSSYYDKQFIGLTLIEQLRSISLFGLLDGKPGLKDGLIHYWFIFYLLIFYTIHFIARPILLGIGMKRIPGAETLMKAGLRRRRGIFAFILLTLPFQYFIVEVSLPPTGFNVPLLDLALYSIFYLFGLALYHHRALLTDMSRNAWSFLLIAAPFVLLANGATSRIDLSAPVIKDITTWTVLDTGSGTLGGPILHWEGLVHNGWDKVLVSSIRSTLCWLMCIGFIGLAHRYLNKPRPLIRYLADSAYWVYWIHLPITFKLSFLAQQLNWGSSLFKSYVVLTTSTLIVYWTYNSFVRYGWLGDYFMGRRKSRTDPCEEEFRLSNLIRRSAPATLLIGMIALLLGQVLHYDRNFQGAPVLVEAYVARDEATLERYDRIDGIVDVFGNTPIHNAVQRAEGQRLYDPLPALIQKSSDLDVQNDFGRTALFVATRKGNRGDIERLLAAGADPDIADIYGHTPAHVAAIKTGLRNPAVSDAYLGLLSLLSEQGADLNLRDSRGRTAGECLSSFGGLEQDAFLKR